MILGTATYMSPEQARGKPVDKRADIWAFGVVLYEMLTGRRLFTGETVSDVLAGVLKTEIDLGGLPESTPPAVRRLIARCLERDPRNRIRDIGDARVELQSALDTHAPDAASHEPRRRSRAGLLPAALGAGLVLGALLSAGVGRFDAARTRPEPAAATWLEIGPPAGRGSRHYVAPSISPDGRRIAFWAPDAAGKLSLWIRSLDSPEARPVPGTSWEGLRAGVPAFWSPEGRSLGFFAEGNLKRIDLDGGAALTLAAASNPRGGSWGAGGVIVFVPAAGKPPSPDLRLRR